MKSISKVLVLLCLIQFPLSAADKSELSTTPVVQTAKWAVKWWMPRHKQKIEEKKKLGDVQLVFLGDSITHAWDNKGKAYWQKNYAKYNALNIGFSGDRTEHVLWRLQNGAVDDINPKVLVLMIGTNNAGHRKEASKETAKGIKAILDDLKVRLPKTKVLMLAIFPRGAKASDPLRKLNDATNEMIKTYADDKHVFFLDINKKFLEEDGTLSKKVMKDLLHPNPNQYPVWGEAIAPKLAELMK